MDAEFNADGAEDEQPEHDHERQIESTESGCVEQRKGEVKSAATSDEPHFVAIPHRTDGADHELPFLICLSNEEMQDAGAEIKAVEHHVTHDHGGDKQKPDCLHNVSPTPP